MRMIAYILLLWIGIKANLPTMYLFFCFIGIAKHLVDFFVEYGRKKQMEEASRDLLRVIDNIKQELEESEEE